MPYAPGIEYRGDQYLFRGISSLGESAAKAIDEYRTTKRESQAADAAFETLVRSAGPLVQSGVIPPEMARDMGDLGKFSGLSASAKKAKLGQLGVSLQMIMQDSDRQGAAADRQSAADLRRSMHELQREESSRRTRREDATSKAVLGMAPVLDMPDDQAGGVLGPALVSALRENPEADATAILDAMTRTQQRQVRARDYYPEAGQMLEPFDVGGRSGLYNRRTGQTMVDQDATDGQASPIRDETGAIIGYGVRSGNRMQIVRPPGALTARDRIELRKRKQELVDSMPFAQTPDEKAVIQSDLEAIDAELAEGAGVRKPADPKGEAPKPVRKYNPATGRLE
jgi:hypothetical protein